MSDIDSYVARCYDLLLQDTPAAMEELCACAKIVEHEDHQRKPQPKE